MTFEEIERNLYRWPIAGWGLTIEIADECCWSAELRITVNSTVNENKSDVSTVFMIAGQDDPLQAANKVLEDARAHLFPDKPAIPPVNDSRCFMRCSWCQLEKPIEPSGICDDCIPF